MDPDLAPAGDVKLAQEVRSLAVCGDRYATVDARGVLSVWAAAAGRLALVSSHPGYEALALTGMRVFGELAVLKVSDGNYHAVAAGRRAVVNCSDEPTAAVLLADELVTADARTVRVWSAVGALLASAPLPEGVAFAGAEKAGASAYLAHLSDDSTFVLVGGKDLYSGLRFRAAPALRGVTGVAVSNDGAFVAVQGAGRARLWSVVAGRFTATLAGVDRPIRAFSCSGGAVVAALGDALGVRLWRVPQ